MKELLIRKDSFYVTKYTGDLKILDDQIAYIRRYDPGRQVSNVGGYQSNFINFGFDDLIFFAVAKFKEIGLEARMSSFWLNANKGSDWNVPHIHTVKGSWAVVYYHKICCDKCPISFSHLVPCVYHEELKYSPKEQDIVFFDDRIPHAVYPCNQDGHERISVAFNFDLAK